MAKSQYVGVDGVARKVDTGYVGVDGVARKLTKGYVGVDGIARECFGGSMVHWKKYNVKSNTTYLRTESNIRFEGSSINSFDPARYTAYTNYTFSSNNGFQGTGDYNSYSFSSSTPLATVQAALTNKYIIFTSHSAELISEVISWGSNPDSSGRTLLTYSGIRQEAESITTYEKGEIFYGVVEVISGILPENGALIEGTLDGDYFILMIDNTLYYYERAQSATWQKYGCVTSFAYIGYTTSIAQYQGGASPYTPERWDVTTYDQYTFDTTNGFSVYGNYEFHEITQNTNLSEITAAIVGKYSYYSSSDELTEYVSIDSIWMDDNGCLAVKYTVKKYAATKETSYSSDSTLYDTIITIDGLFPEEGTLIDGSTVDSYCVIEIDGTKYYYKRV